MIWDVYDDDGNGSLDRDETRKFVTDYLKLMGEEEELADDKFDEFFIKFDVD